MAKEITFYIDNDDLDKLFDIKAHKGESNLTGNDFAKELLVTEIRRQHRNLPRKEEE